MITSDLIPTSIRCITTGKTATASWAHTLGWQLIDFTPGIRTNADYTYPEMGASYPKATNASGSMNCCNLAYPLLS
jgi:hypothetical protein